MAMSSWPYVDVATTDIEYGRLYNEMAATEGVVGSFSALDLQAYGDSSGMSVKVRAGSAVLRGYMFYSTAIETLTVDAPGGQIRTDRVVLELNLSNPDTTKRIVPKVVKGTPGSNTPPALVQTPTGVYQISLALVAISASATNIASSAVTDDRSWIGHKIGVWASDAKRPSSPRRFVIGFNVNRARYEFYNGSAWIGLNDVNLESSNVTGVLPVANGGTGGNDTATARRNGMDLWVQSGQPAYANGRIWVKIP